jgi:hypothetical protein
MASEPDTAYDQGAEDMALTIIRTITGLARQGHDRTDILNGVISVCFARLELGLPQEQWFTGRSG